MPWLQELMPHLPGLAAGLSVGAAPSLWGLFSRWLDPNRGDRLSEQGWTRAGSLEGEVRSLRILLDRCRRRESAKDAVIDILLLALEMFFQGKLTPEMAGVFINRAKEILKRSIISGE